MGIRDELFPLIALIAAQNCLGFLALAIQDINYQNAPRIATYILKIKSSIFDFQDVAILGEHAPDHPRFGSQATQ